jgi:long-chain acyl-CoA synthetase
MTVHTVPAPWLRNYRDVPESIDPPFASGLEMFRATLTRGPQAPLIHYFDQTITAQTIDEMSDSLAVSFDEHGIGVGDRVAMYLQNVPEAMVTVLAAWKCGAVLVPCNPMLRERELKKILVDSGCRALVCHDDLFVDVVSQVLADTAVEHVVTTSPLDMAGREVPALLAEQYRREGLPTSSLPEVLAAYAGRTPRAVELTGDDVALMVYTSGTTGAPKGATNTHRNVVFATSVYEAWLDLDDQDAILGIAPLFHVTGLIGHISLSMLTGAPLILFYRFDAEETCRLAQKYGATFAVSAVTAFIALLNSGAMDSYDLSTLSKVYTGGAPTPPAALRDWQAKTRGTLNPMYGLTEATSPTHMTPFGATPPVDQRTGVVSIGVPVFGTSVRVIGEDGEEVPPGEIGELYISGPQIVPGYWQKPAETEASFTDNELHTGDVGFMDESGWFYLVDRAKDMIVASGFKVWPREVEDVLYEHPAVLEAAVIGVPDPYRGETVKAVVSLKPGTSATPEEIKAFGRERMAAYKYPRVVEVVDTIPKNASGKILRNALRDEAQPQQAALVPPSSLTVSYAELQQALEVRAVIELGVTWLVLNQGGISVGRAVGLYDRLEHMLNQVHADGRFVDREGFLDANQDYHQYLIDLADNAHMSRAFTMLNLRQLFGELLSSSDATSEEVVLQHERLTDALAASSQEGAVEAIIAWAAAAERHVVLTLGDQANSEERGHESAVVDAGRPSTQARIARRAALAEALQAQAILEVGVLRLLAHTGESERLRAALVARTPLLRGSGKERLDGLFSADHGFHHVLVGALGNQLLVDIHESLDLISSAGDIGESELVDLRAMIDLRHPLLSALERGDFEAAIEAVGRQSNELRRLLLGRDVQASTHATADS